MDRMKALARSFVYWPNIDDDVETCVRQCSACAEAAKSPRKTDLESWPIPTKPWERIHIDYAGPMDGYYYLVIVDAYSKWPEVFRTRSTTTTATLEILQEVFARYGNPPTLVSDNGSQFVSSTFKHFCEANGICHLTIAPYHPQSNGQAERFVDTLKRGLKKLVKGENMATLQHLQILLSTYRSTPNRNAPDAKTPAELFLGRPIRTTLDLVKPHIPSPTEVNMKQNAQFNKRHNTIKREFKADDLVYAEIHRRNTAEWVPGTIVERKGRVNYNVLLDNGRLICSHTNQLKQRHEDCEVSTVSPNLPLAMLLEEFNLQPMVPVVPDLQPIVPVDPEVPDEPAVPVNDVALQIIPDDDPNVNIQNAPVQPDRPTRNRRLPSWLVPYDLF